MMRCLCLLIVAKRGRQSEFLLLQESPNESVNVCDDNADGRRSGDDLWQPAFPGIQEYATGEGQARKKLAIVDGIVEREGKG